MKNTGIFTKSLAWAGTILVALPILAPIALARWGALGTPAFRIDWLMPGELGLLAVAGAILLEVAAMRAGARRALVGWGIAVAVGAFLAMAAIATLTGLASGAAEPVGWPLWLTMGAFAVYVAAEAELVVAGVLLLIDVHGRRSQGQPPAVPAM